MDVRAALLREHSKANTMRVVKWIGPHRDRFAELVTVFLGDDPVLAQRAAWVLGHTGYAYPALFEDHLPDFIEVLKEAVHPALHRNILRVLAEGKVSVPEALEGELVDQCFTFVAKPNLPAAIRVFAMQVVANYCAQYPDLAVELKAIIEDQMEHGTPGFRSRGQKILQQLAKLVD